MKQIKFVALGGLDEIGKNCYIIEINNNILIFNAGYKLPEFVKQVSELVIFSTDYLELNKNRILGIFISNIKKSQMGAIAYIANKLNLKIYCSEIIKSNILKSFADLDQKITSEICIIKHHSKLVFNDFEIFVFATNGNTLENLIFAINAHDQLIWLFNDCILDADFIFNNCLLIRDLVKFIDNRQTLLMLCDATNSLKSEFTSPKHKYIGHLATEFKNYQNNRIIISCYDDNLYNALEIIKAGIMSSRSVYIIGETLKSNLKKCIGTYLDSNLFSQIKDIDELKSDESNNPLIILSAEGKQLFNLISNVATNNHKDLKIEDNDVFISGAFSNDAIEILFYGALSEVAKHPIKIVALPGKVIRSMHPSQEDLKLFINLTKPKYIVPIQGLYKDLLACSNFLIKEKLITSENCLVLDNGEMVIFNDGQLTGKDSSIIADSVFVNANKLADIEVAVITERIKLGQNGIVFVSFSYNHQNKEITSKINIDCCGITINQSNNDIFENINQTIYEIFEKQKQQKQFQEKNINSLIANKIIDIIKKSTGKTPKVVVNIFN